jgi:hypothetical protein
MVNYDIDLNRLTRYPIKERRNKVTIADFAPSPSKCNQSTSILDNFPRILTAKDLNDVINHVVEAKKNGRAVMFAIGGHVIKCGLGNIIIHLIECGVLDAVIMNGAASIHDFEIAMIGETSEDVSNVLGEGEFGMAYETGKMHNEAVNLAYRNDAGLGYSLGKYIVEHNFLYSKNSILAAAYHKQIPCIVSVAIGTDITHMHPEASGAAIGSSSHKDFLTLASILPNLSDGGVYFNIGSAVILPEVFLKAFSIVQNLGYDMDGLITVNMDMQSQYRSLTNVVKRPTDRRGKGYNLIGTHEIMVPLLAYGIIRGLKGDK